MKKLIFAISIIVSFIISTSFVSCSYRAPYNDFEPYNSEKNTNKNYKLSNSKRDKIIDKLAQNDIQYFSYGDTKTLIIPTDRFYMENSQKFNQLCYHTFDNIVTLLKSYPNSQIIVAGFEDNIGYSIKKQKLSQARSEEMITFLWANGIKSGNLKAQGFRKSFPISSNKSVHGSAQNRRIEIQWKDIYLNNTNNCCHQRTK